MFKKNNKKAVKIMAVIGLLVFLHIFGWLNWLENSVGRALNPVLSGFYNFSSNIRNVYDWQFNKHDLEKNLKEMEEKLNRLTAENAKLKITEEENKVLREYLRFLAKDDYRYIMANVIARGDISDSAGVVDSIVIDKGREDGVSPGLAVINGQGIIIGKISEVKEDIAKINLTYSKKCKIAATILNEEKTAGITEGKLGLTIEMNFIPQGTKLNIDDLVVTSGLEENIPRGLVVGKIISVDSESNELWQKAIIEPVADINNLIFVSVLLP